MKYTTNYNLKKPETTDFIKVADINDNADIIDTAIEELESDKATITYVDGINTNLTNTLATKATTTYVNEIKTTLETSIATKADDSDVSATIATVNADISDLDTTKAEKSTVTALTTLVNTKATTTDVNTALNLKADKAYVDDFNEELVTQFQIALDSKENKATYIEYTMPAWTSTTFTTLESTYPSSSYNLEIQLSNTCTNAQLTAWQKAEITGSISDNNLYAKGTRPNISIPTYLKIVEVD